MRSEPCTFSNTRHIVIDLARLCGAVPEIATRPLSRKVLQAGKCKAFVANAESDAETVTTVPSDDESEDEEEEEEDKDDEEEADEEALAATRRRQRSKRSAGPEFKAPDLSEANDRGLPHRSVLAPLPAGVPKPSFKHGKVFDPAAPRLNKRLVRGRPDRQVIVR